MAKTPAYADAVKETFRSRALRTVLIIDDQFPTYADMLARPDRLAEFSDYDRALDLYNLFKAHGMPCDVENTIGDLANDVERIRKSDLIVLDYHLTPDSTDPTKSIDLIQKLAETKHFNTIVLYTRERDLVGVWLNIACSLRQGWVAPEAVLASNPSALEEWERLLDEGVNLPRPTPTLVAHYLLSGPRGWPPADRAVLQAELQALGVPLPTCTDIITALVHREVRDELKVKRSAHAGLPRAVVGSFETGHPQWLQTGNCFVALLGKVEGEDEGHPTDATRVLDCLDEAFTAWHPNLMQVLISEIQNILELDALATDEAELRDPATLTGLSYYLLNVLDEGTGPDTPEKLAVPLQALIDKIVETLRHKLVADPALQELGNTLLLEELTELNWPVEKKKVYKAAETIARVRGLKTPSKNDSLFALNSFLSTETFRRGHLTTGTIFRNADRSEYWVCASPSCDMVARIPSDFQSWAFNLHPVRAMIAVRLHEEKVAKALASAHHARFAFVNEEIQRAFSTVDGGSQQPVYEVFFAADEGRWQLADDGNKVFTASRVKADGAGPENARRLFEERFVIAGQLRPSYATRILHLVGQHLSRVGLDFITLPE
jgi:hypothetical protein